MRSKPTKPCWCSRPNAPTDEVAAWVAEKAGLQPSAHVCRGSTASLAEGPDRGRIIGPGSTRWRLSASSAAVVSAIGTAPLPPVAKNDLRPSDAPTIASSTGTGSLYCAPGTVSWRSWRSRFPLRLRENYTLHFTRSSSVTGGISTRSIPALQSGGGLAHQYRDRADIPRRTLEPRYSEASL